MVQNLHFDITIDLWFHNWLLKSKSTYEYKKIDFWESKLTCSQSQHLKDQNWHFHDQNGPLGYHNQHFHDQNWPLEEVKIDFKKEN